MTPRQKRNITLAKQRRLEKARAAYSDAYAELRRIMEMSQRGELVATGHVPEWYGHPPQGVTVQ